MSRNLLPRPMLDFGRLYPSCASTWGKARYTSIAEWVRNGECDLGFTNLADARGRRPGVPLVWPDRMMAVVPPRTPGRENELTLADLATSRSSCWTRPRVRDALHAFEQAGLSRHGHATR